MEMMQGAKKHSDHIVLEYLLSLTKTMYKVQTKILNNQIIN